MRLILVTCVAAALASGACSSLPPAVVPDASVVTPDDDRPTARDDGAPRSDVPTPNDVVVSPTDAGTPRDVASPPTDVVSPRDVVTPTTDVVTPRDVVVPPTDTGPSTDVPVSGAWAMSLPVIDDATRARIREIRALGATRGMRANVFAKIGDSITESGSFLSDIGEGWYNLGAYGGLEATITYFRGGSISGRNSFNRASVCATAGWTAARALESDPNSPLRMELAATRPGYAVVMYGTNDIDQATPDALQTNLTRIAQIIEENGTVPILSTIPDRTDDARAGALALTMNQRIRAVASARHVPLMDYWAALQPLPARGMDGDGIHPNVYRNMGDAQAGDFTAAGLRYGYNARNLVTLLALDRVRAVQ